MFLVVLIGMHLNPITDRAVDRVRKSHLAEWTMSGPWTLRGILIIEVLACLIFLLIAGTVAPSAGIAFWRAECTNCANLEAPR